MQEQSITTLFLDIGGVLLTNGWDRGSREAAFEEFSLDKDEVEERHHLTFDTYEEGKLSLDEYLNRTVFYEDRSFTKEDFKKFMFSRSTSLGPALNYFKELKKQYKLRVIAVSNEGRELNDYRIKKFKLNELFDAYISSCYVHLRKPDSEMLRMACDISHTATHQALYVDDRLMFVEVAEAYGIYGLHYKDLEQAKEHIKTLTFHTIAQ